MNKYFCIFVFVFGRSMLTTKAEGKIPLTVVRYYPALGNPSGDPSQCIVNEHRNTRISTVPKTRERPQPSKSRYPIGHTQDVDGFPSSTEDRRSVRVFSCNSPMPGRQETPIPTVVLGEEAVVIPKDGLYTKTVSVKDKRAVIEIEADRDGGCTQWSKDGTQIPRAVSQDRYLSLPNVNGRYEGIYECVMSHGQTAVRLIVRDCPEEHWGPRTCEGICDNCYNGGVCDHETGTCICPAGFKGKNCLEASRERFGYDGEFQCRDIVGPRHGYAPCQGLLFCLPDPFGCRCASGYKNFSCDEACPPGTFGANCLLECNCDGTCDRYTGKCSGRCLAGYSGSSCQIPAVCRSGYYGEKCLKKCHCRSNSACNRQTGKCENGRCADGYTRQGSENCEVLRPILSSELMSEVYHERNLGGSVTISCEAINAIRIWWEYRNSQQRVKVRENQLLQVSNISFQDQGNYFCVAEGGEQIIVESAPQVVVVSNYLQYMLYISTDETTSTSLRSSRTEEIVNTFESESIGVTPSMNESGIFAYYITKEIKQGHPTSQMKQDISTVFERARNLTVHREEGTVVDMHSLSFCAGETIVTAAGPLSFPDADVNTNVSSVQVCLTSGDLHRGSRRCKGDFTQPGIWEYPSLLNCFTDAKNYEKPKRLSEKFLKIVKDSPLTLQNASYIARDLADLTSTGKAYDIDALASALRKVSDVNCSSTAVTSGIVETIDNVMCATLQSNGTSDAKHFSQNASSDLLRSLEHQLENIQRSGQNYSNVKANIAVKVVHVTDSENPITFASLLPSSEQRNGSGSLENNTIVAQTLGDLNLTEISASIQLPKEVSRLASNKTQTDPVPVTFVVHRSGVLFSDKEQDFELNSFIISASVPETIKNLPEKSNVLISLQPLKENGEQRSKCVYWNFSMYNDSGGWSQEGCVLVTSGSSYFCRCNHLTNFAVLMDVHGDSNNKVLDIISSIGCLVSITSLFITVVSFLAVRNLRSRRPQQIVLNLCLALIGLYTSFLAGIDKPHLGTWCILFGGLIHYFCLASVAWMTVEAVNMYLLFVKVVNAQVDYFMVKASLFAWGVPLIVVVSSITLSTSSYSHPEYCFPKHSSNVFYAFVIGILGALVALNATIFMIIFWKLTCSGRAPTNTKSKARQLRSRLQNAVAISVLLGLTWSFGFLAFGNLRLIFNTLFCIFNSLQGFAIFLLFCVRQKGVRNTWKMWLSIPSGKRPSSMSSRAKSQQRTTMTDGKSTISLNVLKDRSQMNFQ